MSDETDLDMDSIDAIVAMHNGDFSRVANMLREGKPMHLEVRALLAEYVSSGNSHGRLNFVRPHGRPPIDHSERWCSAFAAWRDVQARLNEHKGVKAAMQFVAANGAPARSDESVCESYYLWRDIMKRLNEDLNGGL